jgi:hypothetical protein
MKATQLPPGFKLAEDDGITGTDQKKQIWGVLASAYC